MNIIFSQVLNQTSQGTSFDMSLDCRLKSWKDDIRIVCLWVSSYIAMLAFFFFPPPWLFKFVKLVKGSSATVDAHLSYNMERAGVIFSERQIKEMHNGRFQWVTEAAGTAARLKVRSGLWLSVELMKLVCASLFRATFYINYILQLVFDPRLHSSGMVAKVAYDIRHNT